VLYLNQGVPIFTVKPNKGSVSRVTSEKKVSGKTEIIATLKADGSSQLTINGDSVAKGKSGLLRSHPQEHLNVGFDDANPVDPQAPGGNFNGKIHQIEVKSGATK
jgi:hypothetical protein